MTIETALYPNQLNATLPPQSDIVREGAGHLRLLKTVVKTTFPNLGGAWNATQTEANYIVGVTSPIQAQINSKGAITGQTWTGAHVFSGTATLPAATTIGAVTAAELAHLSGVTSPIQAQFAAKASLNGATYTGAHNYSGASSVTLPAATSIGSITSTELGYLDGVTAPIQAQLGGKADITGESYSGTHDFTGASIAVPTLPTGSSGNSAASVDYANALAFASALPAQTGNSGKFITTNGVTASWSDTIDGNINITGTGRRITGDFSNASVANRVMVQASVAGNTSFGVMPNGTGSANVALYGSSDLTNAPFAQLVHLGNEIRLLSSFAGTGSYVPITFYTGGLERLRIDPTTGNVLVTSGALGYGIGAGGTVVQATSKSTAVTLNKPTGRITMSSAALPAGATVSFMVNNSVVTEFDVVSVCGLQVHDWAGYGLKASVSNGVFLVHVTNLSAASMSEPLVICFSVVKGASS